MPAQQSKTAADYVNVFTGTSNSRWMLFPGPTMPFGMVKLSPDNQNTVWNGGYEYTVGSISGFSHVHAMGLSGLSVMPLTGTVDPYPDFVKLFPGEPDGPYGTMWTAGYRSRIRKETEKGCPGYYAVTLLDYNIRVEISTTTRCGVMRLTYPESDQAHLLVNFDFPAEEHSTIHEAWARKTSATQIEGSIRQSNQYGGSYTLHYVLELSKPITSLDGWVTDSARVQKSIYGIDWQRHRKVLRDITALHDSGSCGIVMNFATAHGERVIVRSGISFVSIANARENLATEMKPFGWNFQAVVTHARKAWNDLLGTITITDDNDNHKRTFYTCLYRTFTAKCVMNDCSGEYSDMCGNVQRLSPSADAVYSADAFWGVQWTLAPLWTLVTPGYASSWVRSLLEMADKGGWIPEAPTGLKYAPIMGAQHQNALIISSYQKGIRDFDAGKAFGAITHDLTTQGIDYPCGGYAGNRQMQAYMDYGFVPDESGPVSNTMEYAYDDWCAGQFALALNKGEAYRQFNVRAENYRHVYDSSTGYVRRKHSDGRWVEPFDPFAFGTVGGWNGPGFMEGTAWIYTFFVPHDLAGLIALMGRNRFNGRLEEGFTKHFVDLGNEPNLQAPFLFNYSGRPWRTQYYSRFVMDHYYDNSPYTGWVGEEDEGQLSAYFVLLSMGLFEMDGGCAVEPFYDLSGPLFTKVTIQLDARYYPGKTFTISSIGNSATNIYIQSATLNGKPLRRPILYHRDIARGGELIFRMGPQPNLSWGVAR